jgi:hypothetical protein
MSSGQQRLAELDRGQPLRLLGSFTLGRIVFTGTRCPRSPGQSRPRRRAHHRP